MQSVKLPKSLRKFVRLEKAKIRREFFDLEKQDELILGLYKTITERSQKKEKHTQTAKVIPQAPNESVSVSR